MPCNPVPCVICRRSTALVALRFRKELEKCFTQAILRQNSRHHENGFALRDPARLVVFIAACVARTPCLGRWA